MVGGRAMTQCPAVARGGAIPVTSADEQRRSREAELVRRAQAGDRIAFEELYRDNVRRVYALCFRMTGTADLAEELAQDVFVRAWQKLGSFRGESAFSSWLHPLTVNVALSERRSRRRRDHPAPRGQHQRLNPSPERDQVAWQEWPTLTLGRLSIGITQRIAGARALTVTIASWSSSTRATTS